MTRSWGHLSKRQVLASRGQDRGEGGEVLDLGFLVCIDTGCYAGGWLTALEVSTRRFWQADRGGRLRN